MGEPYVPTNRDIDAIIESVVSRDIGESKKSEDDSKYSTPDVFVQQYSKALEDYLVATAGKGETHLHDFAASTAQFSEAFWHIVTNFS